MVFSTSRWLLRRDLISVCGVWVLVIDANIDLPMDLLAQVVLPRYSPGNHCLVIALILYCVFFCLELGVILHTGSNFISQVSQFVKGFIPSKSYYVG